MSCLILVCQITKIGYCNEGHRIFTASMDKTIKIWDTSSLQLQMTIGCDDGVCIIRFGIVFWIF